MKILLGISGGVDSAYAALKLKKAGHTVEGAVLVMHGYTELEEARLAAESVGIPLHVIDLRGEFEACVVENFISEYKSARTPNPCIICNSEIKFKYLLDFAEERGFDAIATGHYAKTYLKLSSGDYIPYSVSDTVPEGARVVLKMGNDIKKDQTYMLWRLPQRILKKLCLPLGEDLKSDVKAEARAVGISAAEREESQEICFIPDNDYAAFIERRCGGSPKGNFVDEDGKVLGEHNGIIRYTIGQRKGLGISYSSRIFVTEISPETNTVHLSAKDPTSDFVKISGLVFAGIEKPQLNREYDFSVKLRYAAPRASAKVIFREGGVAEVKTERPVRAVTAGQSCVFYDGDYLIGGGFIDFANKL